MDYASRYAELAVRVGVNLQEGQKLVVYGEPEHAPLLRAVAEAGWRAGAGDVVCFYVDDHVRRLHALHAADQLLDRTPAWLETAALDTEDARRRVRGRRSGAVLGRRSVPSRTG